MKTWQRTGGDNWVFGEKVRGIVRHLLAEIYFNEKGNSPNGGWVWFTHMVNPDFRNRRGLSGSLIQAVKAAEAAMLELELVTQEELK